MGAGFRTLLSVLFPIFWQHNIRVVLNDPIVRSDAMAGEHLVVRSQAKRSLTRYPRVRLIVVTPLRERLPVQISSTVVDVGLHRVDYEARLECSAPCSKRAIAVASVCELRHRLGTMSFDRIGCSS